MPQFDRIGISASNTALLLTKLSIQLSGGNGDFVVVSSSRRMFYGRAYLGYLVEVSTFIHVTGVLI